MYRLSARISVVNRDTDELKRSCWYIYTYTRLLRELSRPLHGVLCADVL